MATTSSPSRSDGLGMFAADQHRPAMYGYNSPPRSSPLRSHPQPGPSPSPRHFPSPQGPQRSSRPANPSSSLYAPGSPTRLPLYQTNPNTPPQRYRVTNPDPPSPLQPNFPDSPMQQAQASPQQQRAQSPHQRQQQQQQSLHSPHQQQQRQQQRAQSPAGRAQSPAQQQQQQYRLHQQQLQHQQNQQRRHQPSQSLSLMPPPPQPSFAPSASSPLRPQSETMFARQPRDATSDEMYADASESDERPRSKSSHGSNNSGNGKGLRLSKSTEFLRNFANKGKGHAYTELHGEDDDEELLRQPAGARPKRHSLASLDLRQGSPGPEPPNTARSAWTGSKEALASGFPQPPPHPTHNDNPYLSDHGFSSQDSFTTAHGSGGAISPIPPGAGMVRARPWPAQASPQTAGGPRIGDPLVPIAGPHSRSDLFAAETGGVLTFNGETYQHGAGPSAPLSQFPRPPASDSHSSDHPSSSGSSSRPDFTKPRAAPMPDWNEPAPPMSWVAPAEWTSEWSQPRNEAQSRRPTRHARSYSDGMQLLNRQGTLLHPDSSGERLSEELGLMLGKPRNRRLSAGRLLPPPEVSKLRKPDHVRLEASKKRRARVELDVVLERECAIEGGDLRGRLEVVVHGGKRTSTLRVGHGKVRVIGFEEINGIRHIFYQHQYPLPVFQHWPNGPRTTLFGDAPDDEGFCVAKEGTHAIPFSIPLPVGEGAKGTYTSHDPKGPNIRYVVVGSVKIFVPKKEKRAIAHFYRPCVILPYLNPAIVLAPARAPIMTQRTCGLGWSLGGEKGKVLMQVALGRRIWVAGQRVWCEVAVKNDSNKKITKCSLAVIQTVNTYMPKKGKQAMSREPTTSHRRKVAEETVEADFMDLGSGHVTGKGWWTGLEPGEGNRWDLSCPIPSGMLSIPRSRYVEVLFTLRVTLNNSIFVDMPIEAINFLSIDPPPMPGDTRRIGGRLPVVSPSGVHGASGSLSQLRSGAGGEASTLSQMAAGNLGTVSSAGGGYDLDQLRGRNLTPDADGISNANPSSTTLHIDTVQQNARMQEAEAAQTPRNSQPPIVEVTEDLAPRPGSPDSQYSTHGKRSNMSTMASKYSVQSIDEDERNLLEAEQARRDGRATITQTLATQQEQEELERREKQAMQEREREHAAVTAAAAGVVAGTAAGAATAPSMEVTAPDESDMPTPVPSPPRSTSPSAAMSTLNVPSNDNDDLESVVSATYAPSHDPKEVEYGIGSEEDEYTDAEDEDHTPHGSPTLPPLTLAPRPLYLSHISEEEEPLDDETLSELMSEDAQHARHISYLNDDDDDLLAEQPGEGGFMESTPRRSVEDRLRSACSPRQSGVEGMSSPTTPRASSSPGDHSSGGTASGVSAALAKLSMQGRGGSPGARDTFGPPSSGHRSNVSSVDYTEPIEVEDISMTDVEDSNDNDLGYDADAVSSEAHGSSYATSPMAAAFQRHVQSRSLPGSWEPSGPPALPRLESARDITWGGVLTGRTVSGKSLKIPLDHLDDPPLASPSSGTFGTISHTSSSASNSNGTPSTTRSMPYESQLVHDHESRNLAALAEGREDYDYPLVPPRYNRTDSANTSFHTAGSRSPGSGSGSGSSGEYNRNMPTLAPSNGSSSGSDNESIPSPPTQGQPVYSLPLPPPPPGARSPTTEQTATIPERFKPKPRVASGDSLESHMSSISGMSDVLPGVRARIAALENRDTALRSFGPASAASSTRVMSPQSTGHGLRPTHTGASIMSGLSHGLRPASPGGSQLRAASPSGSLRPSTPSEVHLRPVSPSGPAHLRPSTPSEVHLRPISPALTGGSVSSNGSARSKRKSYTSTLAPRDPSTSSNSQYSMTPVASSMGHLVPPSQAQDDDQSVYSHDDEHAPPPPVRELDDETPRATHQTMFQQVNVPDSSDPRSSVLTTATYTSESSSSTLRPPTGIPPAPITTQRTSILSTSSSIEAPAPPKSPVPRGPRPPLRSQTSKPTVPQHAPSASIPSGMWLSGVAATKDKDDDGDDDSRRSSRPHSEIHTVHTYSTEATTPRWSGSTRSSPSKKSSEPSPSKSDPSKAAASTPSGAFAKLTGHSPRTTPKRLSPEPLEGFARGAQGAYAINTAGSRGSRASLAAPEDPGYGRRSRDGSPSGSPLASPRIGALGTVGEHRRNSLQQFFRSGPSSSGHGVTYTEAPGYVAEARSPLMVRSATASMEGNIETMSASMEGNLESMQAADEEEQVGRELRQRGAAQRPQLSVAQHLAVVQEQPQPQAQPERTLQPPRSPTSFRESTQPQQLQYDPQTESYVPAPAPAEYAPRSPRSAGSHNLQAPNYPPPSPSSPTTSMQGKLSPHSTGTGHVSDVSSEWSTGYSAVSGRLPPRRI